MEVPDTRGQSLFFALLLKNALPAFKSGFSGLPPPATTPTCALHRGENVFSFFEGSKIVIPFSDFATTLPKVPAARINFPPSPGIDSIL